MKISRDGGARKKNRGVVLIDQSVVTAIGLDGERERDIYIYKER